MVAVNFIDGIQESKAPNAHLLLMGGFGMETVRKDAQGWTMCWDGSSSAHGGLSVVFFLEWVVQGFLLLEYRNMQVMNSTILWWL